MEISVIVATCNRDEALMATLRSLAESQVPADLPWEVLVVDNNSTDCTKIVVEAFIGEGHSRFRYLFEPRQGKAFAINTGIREATGRIIALTDDDCIVDSQWIMSILQEYDSDPDLAVVGGRVELYDQRDKAITVRVSQQRLLVSSVPFEPSFIPIIGCNVAFKRKVYDEIGNFDHNLGPGSKGHLVADDTDFLYRAYKNGFKVVYSPDVLVYHNHGRRTDAAGAAVSQQYVRGRGAFYCKHVLRRDDAVIKMAYWETLGVTKSLVRKLLAGNTVGSEVALLWNLGIGAMYGFKAYAPRMLLAIRPGIREGGP
jgi:glycosyltransferase involved in cell wall biosynthesis